MDKVIGIDLGTTNSCVAVVHNGTPTVIANRGGYKTTPSMVAMTEAGKKLVGHLAKRQAITNAEHTVYAAKRLIGRKWDSPQVKQVLETASYRLVKGPHDDARISLRDKVYSVPEISAMVLAEMKVVAEDYLGHEVHKAVITVPAYFNDNQRQATKDAGTIAGLDVIRIINEPTAAALAYGYGRKLDKLVAVYDLGGGTFDISVLEIGSGGVFKVISTAGDTFLGGEDFDGKVIDWLVEGFQKDHGVDLRKDRMALQRLKDAAEKAKIELSTVKETEINLPFIISSGRNEALHLQRTLTREQFEGLCGELVQRSIQMVQQTLDDAGIDRSEIEDAVVVGGMTRMPMVERAVAEFFGRAVGKGVHADEAVAIGAAIQGSALVDQTQKVILLDVTPHTLGVAIAGGGVEPVIEQNTTIPTSSEKPFTTSRDNQTAVKIVVVQGGSDRADQNDLLGEFTLGGLRSARAGEVQIDVTFEIDADGIVSVSARDRDTGREQQIVISARSGLSREEMAKVMADGRGRGPTGSAPPPAAAAGEFEARRKEAEALIAEVDGLLEPVRAVVGASDYGRDALHKAKAAMERARGAIERRDPGGTKEAVDSLGRTLRMFKGVVSKG